MPSLEELAAIVRELDETKFAARFDHPFLMSEGAASSAALAGSNEPTQKVRAVAAPTLMNAAAKGPVVLFVKRNDKSKHPTIITVGRGEDCDLRLAHPLVSKRHAYFNQSDQGWCVNDAESSNGTFAGGERLEPHKPYPLSDNTTLRFGPEVKYQFFSNIAFYKYLTYRSKMRTGEVKKP